MHKRFKATRRVIALALIVFISGVILAQRSSLASSHMDAPLITLDPAANTTDVYAFVQNEGGVPVLVTALGVYPHEEPGIGPNKYNFDDNVLYEIHIATGNDLRIGKATFSYQFRFATTFKKRDTILQSYLGVVNNIGDAGQNLVQTYTVTKVDRRSGKSTLLGTGICPPNNQGNATPFYNQGDDGENPAKDGVATEAELDRYTRQAISPLRNGYIAFAGQRDDGFAADIQQIFDLLRLRTPNVVDSQHAFNLHLMALAIPISELGGEMQVVGVYATTSRRAIRILNAGKDGVFNDGPFVQVARQGNPLFNEALVAIEDKDLYSRTSPVVDPTIFRKYALNPELARLANALVFKAQVAPETNRTDIAGIYIPDLIKVDLSTGPVRLAGGGPSHPTTPDDPGFSPLSVFGNDVVFSRLANQAIPSGWPNGRRFGDNVVSIAVSALASDLRVSPAKIVVADINTILNDMAFNKVFPYESTPQNGRNHTHR